MACVAALAVWAAAPRPAAALAVGDTVRERVSVGRKQVPLPRGDWLVAGVGTQELDPATAGDAFGAIASLVLARRDPRRGGVVGLVEINANTVPVTDGWGTTRTCERAGQFLLLTRYRSGRDLSCVLVQPTYAPAGGPGPKAWREALRAAALAGLDVPELWLTAGFRISDRQDIVDVRYHFAPGLLIDGLARAGGGDARADWSADAVGRDPRRLAAVRLLASWAVGADEWIERGLRNQLDGAATLDTPRRAAFFSNTPQIDAKLLELERLFRAGAMSPEALRAQEAEALVEVPVLDAAADPIERSLAKSVSLSLAQAAVDRALALAAAAEAAAPAALSGWLAAPAALAYSAVFVLNDRGWEARWARAAAGDVAADRVVEFVHLGVAA